MKQQEKTKPKELLFYVRKKPVKYEEWLKKDTEKRMRYKEKFDSLKGIKFTHRDDPKKTVFTIESVSYPRDCHGIPNLGGYGNWNFLVCLDWEGKKDSYNDHFKITHAFTNFKEGVWIPVK